MASIAAMALLAPSAGAQIEQPQQTLLYAFHGTDGASPYKLVQGADGTLFGATSHGGAYGAGTVFALKAPLRGGAQWLLTVLASIPPNLPGQLYIAPSGAFAFYGTTSGGGNPGPYGGYCDYFGHDYGCGTAFVVSPPAGGGSWTTTTVYDFSSGSGEPNNTVVLGGSMYGTAGAGGYPSCYGQSGCGGAFALSPPASGQTAWTESMPIAFLPGSDGVPPYSYILGTGVRGDVYGAYTYGGPYNVFSLGLGSFATFGTQGTPQGVVADEHGAIYIWASTSNLYAFFPPKYSGKRIYKLPAAGFDILVAHDGAVYAADTPAGRPASLVALTPAGSGRPWTPQVIYTFTNPANGANPNSVLFGKSGELYGTTSAGGAANDGVIYRITSRGRLPQPLGLH